MTVAIDYSQAGEQAAILSWADGRHGSFVDLGAYDGHSYSNTAALADAGWPGICIDAAPDAAEKCTSRYADREDISVVCSAFDPEPGRGPVQVWWTPDYMNTSLIEGWRDDAVELYVDRLDLEWLVERCAELPRPLFCSIDLEGGNVSALAWVLEHITPDCVCVEANNTSTRRPILGLLDGWREVFANDWNVIRCR